MTTKIRTTLRMFTACFLRLWNLPNCKPPRGISGTRINSPSRRNDRLVGNPEIATSITPRLEGDQLAFSPVGRYYIRNSFQGQSAFSRFLMPAPQPCRLARLRRLWWALSS